MFGPLVGRYPVRLVGSFDGTFGCKCVASWLVGGELVECGWLVKVHS